VDAIASEGSAIVLRLTTVAASACCPGCRQVSSRIHSRYRRALTDLPWNQVSVCIHLRNRKFFCDTSDCPRRVFTEPPPYGPPAEKSVFNQAALL